MPVLARVAVVVVVGTVAGAVVVLSNVRLVGRTDVEVVLELVIDRDVGLTGVVALLVVLAVDGVEVGVRVRLVGRTWVVVLVGVVLVGVVLVGVVTTADEVVLVGLVVAVVLLGVVVGVVVHGVVTHSEELVGDSEELVGDSDQLVSDQELDVSDSDGLVQLSDDDEDEPQPSFWPAGWASPVPAEAGTPVNSSASPTATTIPETTESIFRRAIRPTTFVPSSTTSAGSSVAHPGYPASFFRPPNGSTH